MGTGASARVYEATDTMLRRKVALKALHPALVVDARFRKRFRVEAQSAAGLSHPHLLAVYDWGESGGEVYIVTELLAGGSLRDYLDSGHRLTPSQALLVGLHTVQGLAAAHAQGLVHRDIKPANLLFGADKRLRVADFGIARAVAEAVWTEPEGALVGTVRYAAPEQGLNGEVDGRTDIYSLALTLIEAVTGEVPLVADSPIATMVMRADTDVEVPELLGPLRSVLTPAGRFDRTDRPSAEEFAQALKRAATRLPRPEPLAITPTGPSPEAVLHPETGRIELPESDLTVVELGGETADTDLMGDPEPATRSARRRWPLVVALVLSVAGAAGYAGYRYYDTEIRIPTHTVSGYVGRSIAEVTNEIEVNGWRANVTETRRDGSEAGEILEQSPPAGTVMEENQPVTLVVSLGEELRTVPTLVGLDLGAATTAIEVARLQLGEVDDEAFDEEVPAGTVLSSSLDPGGEVEPGTTIDLTVSAGPQPRVVPAVEGLTLEEVTALVDELGLVLVTNEDFSDEVEEGLAIGILPEPGESLERGAEVTVTVSKGVAYFEIPNVVGLDAAAAADKLEAAGFVVADTNGPPNAPVLATDPPAGEFHPKGKSIVIFTRR